MVWRNLFWGRSDQSNDEINLIPAHFYVAFVTLVWLVWKRGWILEARSENGRLEKDTFSDPFWRHIPKKIYQK